MELKRAIRIYEEMAKDQNDDIAQLVLKALKRLTIKKPKVVVNDKDFKIGNITFKKGTKRYTCECGNFINYSYKYCPYCGCLINWEVEMKYFEIKNPYYALIAAGNEKYALIIYEEKVCDVDDKEKFYEELKEIDIETAKRLFMNSKDEDGNKPTEKEVEKAFNTTKNDVLLIDYDLI
jgi:hypothetical protein